MASTRSLSARSGLAIAILTSVCFSASVYASIPGIPLASIVRTAIVGAVFLWPFAYGAHYAATRWTGVTPTPVLDGLLGRGGLRVAAIRAPHGVLYAFPVILGSAIATMFVPVPEVTQPEGVPFANMGALQTFAANLLIVAEEFVFRLVLLFPLAALFGVRNASRRALPGAGFWAALLVSSVLFGYVHIVNAPAMGADPTEYAVFAVVQKGLVAGTIFGYVAWRYGLEASILCHYATNILLVLLGLALGGQA